jgi:hypothetical protein
MNFTTGKIAAVVVAGGLVVATAGAASAAAERRGYKECNPNRDTQVTSTTARSGVPAGSFAVSHRLGASSFTWSTAGSHSRVFAAAGGEWAVSTNGSISSAGAACV